MTTGAVSVDFAAVMQRMRRRRADIAVHDEAGFAALAQQAKDVLAELVASGGDPAVIAAAKLGHQLHDRA